MRAFPESHGNTNRIPDMGIARPHARMLDLVLPRTRRGQEIDRGSLPFQERRVRMTAKERRRANRRKKHEREAMLEMRNMCGNKDLTPYNAILQMRTNGKAEIRLK